MTDRLMKRVGVHLSLLMISLFFLPSLRAQIFEPATWKVSHSNTKSGEVTITFEVTLDGAWHIYDVELPEGGPTPTAIELDGSRGVKLVGGLVPSRAPEEVYDNTFEMNLKWYTGSVTFTQKAQIEDPANFRLQGDLVYMLCDDNTCLPPTREEFSITPADLTTPLKMEAIATEPADETAQENVEEEVVTAKFEGDIWTPVISELKAYGDGTLGATDNSILIIFIFGFLGGLVALLTPCVWPMIPMTVSFFLKRTKSRKAAIRDAVIYGLAIIVIYVSLGLIITGIFGASALNDLATNAIFNIIFFLLLVVFAISFFGAFEIVLPSSWTNKMDAKAESTTGILSIFFMAFTLVLVSFSCTGPIIGTLLVEAASRGNILGPAIGMVGFATALAIPFALFAIFPNFLQNMPKSGGWLNTVKVVLGFLELALALKFLSVADLAYGWGILDREVFVSLWIVIFVLLGVYLLGKLQLPNDDKVEKIGVPRLFMAIISLAFAVYMVPGLWGAPLKAISAFAPPLYTQDFNLYESEVRPQFDDYEAGMNYARQVGKPVMLDFSGYGCVNCREMEASVWTDTTVKDILDNDFILITLMVDDKTRLPVTLEVEENGKSRKLKSIGDKWSYFQRTKFGSNAQPFYVMLDPNGMPLGPSYGHNLDVSKYIEWLRGGLQEFSKRK